jgi:uncharacterized protein YjbI with pentapeptide repeats
VTGGKCAKCGTRFLEGAAFCVGCRAPVGKGEKPQEEQRARQTASDDKVSDPPAPAAATQQSIPAPQQPRPEDGGSSPEGVQQKPWRLVPRLGGSSLAQAAEVIAALAAVIALIPIAVGTGKYLLETDDRHHRRVDGAWQIVTSARGHAGSGGRVTALEFLNENKRSLFINEGKQSLVGVSAAGAFLNNLDLEGAELNHANFQEAGLDGANLQDAELWRANLRGAYLGASLDEKDDLDRRVQLDEANLDEADLRDAYLGHDPSIKDDEASLQNTSLKLANLHGAVLDGADLREAKLGDANLQQASLRGADLRGASLGDANLEDADIRDADLRGAKNLFPDQLEEAIGDKGTRLSERVERPSSWKQGTEIPLSFFNEDPQLQPTEYSSKAFEPAMRFTVDKGWRASVDMRDQVVLSHGYTHGIDSHYLSFINVQEVFDPRDPTYDLRRASLDNVLPPPDDLARWLQKHPYLDTDPPLTEKLVQVPVDGKPAVQLDVVVDSFPSNYPTNCPVPCVPLFRDSQRGWWALYEGYKARMTMLDVQGETVVFSIESLVDETDEFFPMGQNVVDTVRWVDNLEVPNLSALTKEEAENRVGQNFNLEASYRPSSEPKGRVLNQNPPPGEVVTQGSEISLTVSQGPEPGITYKTVSGDSGLLIEVGVEEGWNSRIDQDKNEIMILTDDRSANVISSSATIPPKWSGVDAHRYGELETGKELKTFPGYHQLAPKATNVFGVPGFRRLYEWDPKDGEPVTQIQQYYTEKDRGYTATATTTSDNFEKYEPQLLDALNRITLIR